MSRRRRTLNYALVFAVGLTLGAVGLVAGAGGLVKTSTTGGTPVISVRPTGVGLPLVGADGTVGAGDYASELKTYHDSGDYAADLKAVDQRARSYLVKRAATKRKPALVLDIDETSLSNYKYLSAANFSGTLGALALGVANADDPPIYPTLNLFRVARRHGVAVFFITGRPDNIPGVRSQTVANLHAPATPAGRACRSTPAGSPRSPTSAASGRRSSDAATRSSPTWATRRATCRAATPTGPSSSPTPSTSSAPEGGFKFAGP